MGQLMDVVQLVEQASLNCLSVLFTLDPSLVIGVPFICLPTVLIFSEMVQFVSHHIWNRLMRFIHCEGTVDISGNKEGQQALSLQETKSWAWRHKKVFQLSSDVDSVPVEPLGSHNVQFVSCAKQQLCSVIGKSTVMYIWITTTTLSNSNQNRPCFILYEYFEWTDILNSVNFDFLAHVQKGNPVFTCGLLWFGILV